MRSQKGGVAHIAATIEDDLQDRQTKLHKAHISGLADLTASALTCRNANTGEWLAVLPRVACTDKAKENYISRFLANKLIDPINTMKGYIPELMDMQQQHDLTIILMLDQSKIAGDFECLMVSMRVGERAIPVAWTVVKTQGEIGFDIQKKLLDKVAQFVPRCAQLLLAADRFYGTSSLIALCQSYGWQYRIRLKGNLIFTHKMGEITPMDAFKNKLTSMIEARFNKTDVITNIGIICEQGHKEPWFIAMDCVPTKYKTLDYGMRWGIECMFSDFKSRGFSITKTQLKHPDRIERLILVLTIALYWAVSTGMQPRSSKYTKKNKNAH